MPSMLYAEKQQELRWYEDNFDIDVDNDEKIMKHCPVHSWHCPFLAGLRYFPASILPVPIPQERNIMTQNYQGSNLDCFVQSPTPFL